MKINIKFCAINSKTHAHKDADTDLAICEENHIINKGRAIKTNMATAREKVRLNRMLKMMWGSQMKRREAEGWGGLADYHARLAHTRATHAPIRVESRSI